MNVFYRVSLSHARQYVSYHSSLPRLELIQILTLFGLLFHGSLLAVLGLERNDNDEQRLVCSTVLHDVSDGVRTMRQQERGTNQPSLHRQKTY
jgi:hypothetical protein